MAEAKYTTVAIAITSPCNDPSVMKRFTVIKGCGFLCGLDLVKVGVIALLLQCPQVHRLLHPQPKSRVIAQQFTQADRHVRRDWAAFVQNFRHSAARYAQPICKLLLRNLQFWQYIFPQNSAGVRGFACFAAW